MEITIYHIVATALASFGIGFTVGKHMKKSITSRDAHCKMPMEHGKSKSIKLTRMYADDKCFDVNCVYLIAEKKCHFTNEKCPRISEKYQNMI